MEKYKMLVISDSHGYSELARKAIEKEKPFDMLIHCGDLEGTISSITGERPTYDVKVVRGNCDNGNSLPIDEEFKAGFFKVWVNHGNKYNVKYENKLNTLIAAAKSRCADVVFFGHSHYAEVLRDDATGIVCINPGCIGNPKMSGNKSTYAVVTVTDDYEIIPEIKEIEN